MKGEHEHNWHYNEAKSNNTFGEEKIYSVVRFCDRCLEVEELPLKTNKSSHRL